jgi:hypothetical protein
MTKKVVKKKVVVHKSVSPKEQERKVEKILIENFVSLQKVMVNLSVKFDDLTKQISELLNLFEESAKALVKKDFSEDKSKGKEMMDKLNSLMDQNKIIAKGLTLMHETASNPDIHYSLAPLQKESEQAQPVRKESSKSLVKEEVELKVPKVPSVPESGFPRLPSDKNFP